MKATWSSAFEGGGCGKFMGARNRSNDGQYINTTFASYVAKALKIMKSIKLRLRTTLIWMTIHNILT